METDHKTLPDYLLNTAKYWVDQGRETFLIDGNSGELKLYKDLDIESLRIACNLHNRGLRKGDIVIHLTTYQIQQFPLMLGVWRANGVIRSLYVEEAEEVILEKIIESTCHWVFCDAGNAARIKELQDKIPWTLEIIVCGPGLEGFETFDDLIKEIDGECYIPETEVNEDDIALILPTSGTTGNSKGAVHTHKSALETILLCSLIPYTLDKPNLIATKGVHVSGTIFPLTVLVNGATVIVLHDVRNETIFHAVDTYKPGFLIVLLSYLHALASPPCNIDITSIERIMAGGAQVTPPVREKMLSSFPNLKHLVIEYGMTEALPTSITSIEQPCPSTSVGKAFPRTQFEVRGVDDCLKVMEPLEQGELCVKGNHVFKEYFKNAEATRNAFTPDGWLRTGDLGYVDDSGFLYVVDRTKEIFKYFGNHISPTEIETVIGQHPHVGEACVIPVPYEEGGSRSEVPRAYVTLKNPKKDATKESLVQLANEIRTFANDKLASYKRLRGGLFIVDEFPKGKSGKVARRLVAEKFKGIEQK